MRTGWRRFSEERPPDRSRIWIYQSTTYRLEVVEQWMAPAMNYWDYWMLVEQPEPPPKPAPPKPMNMHIIVGPNGRCLCGHYSGDKIRCETILDALADLVKHANIEGSGVHLYVSTILLLDKVIKPLVQDCTNAETPLLF